MGSYFPPDFYRELFRLRNLPYPASTVKRPQYFGHYTNDHRVPASCARRA